MARVTQITWSEIVATTPGFEPWHLEAAERVDLLVVAAGFEERARAILNADLWPNPKQVLAIEYPTNLEDNRETFDAIYEKSCFLESIRYERRLFLEDCRQYFNRYSGFSGKHLVVDLSGMSSYVFFCLMETLVQCCAEAKVSIFYAEALEYFPTKGDLEGLQNALGSADDLLQQAEIFEKRNFQSRGIDAVYESELFPGRNVGDLPTRLVVIPNFSRDRTETMITRACELYNAHRDNVVWLIGQPPDEAKNGWRVEGLSRLYFANNLGVPVSTLNYKEMAWKLSDLWEEFESKYHMVILTLGSKMQHLGTFLFLQAHKDVGLVLSEPGGFVADRFSKGVGSTWKIQLGSILALRELILKRGMMKFEW